jgi:ABC-2 type transport system ATP-binding protein
MNPVIRLDRVVKRFGSQTALQGVSLETPPGVVFALLGENGAGKTTAIRIMLGLTAPDSGSSEVLGLNSQRDGLEIRRRVGYVPEHPTLYDWMTVAEIGWFTSGFYGDGFLPRYQQLTAGFSLPASRKLKELSKGMRAKVSLALAVAHDPQLLVLDEPTSGLDPLVRREFLESMVDRAAAEQTVLLSSHQIAEVERVADIVAILRRGELVLVERLDDLKAQVRELTITLPDRQTAPPEIPGEILWRQRRERQWQALVRNLSEEAFRGLQQKNAAVQAVESRWPNLEEIFIALMKSDGDSNVREGGADSAVAEEASSP